MKNATGHNIPLDLIAHKLSGEASSGEKKELESWISENEEHRKIFEEYSRLWEKSGDIKNIDKIDIDKEWEKFNQRTGIEKPARRIINLKLLTRLAAAIFAGLILGYSGLLIYRSLHFEKIAANDQAREISLPDGSLVTLNAGSEIKFPKNFKEDNRKVKLEGEGFFDVVNDPLKPFSVEAAGIIVKVLGTSFNIDAKGDESTVTVIVAEGKVGIYGKSGNALSGELVRGDKAVINPGTGRISKTRNDNPNFNTYKTGHIVFENSSFKEVLNTLQEVYNVNIHVKDSEVYDKRITVTFRNKDFDYVLRTIQETLDLDIEKSGREIIIR
ncbi:MAG: FecR domain-containing protein [Bacteroidota bacterium]|nr:FecR domain-containing protein [Bacteroidota bacterium]